jgi:hypothetical protein
MSKNIDIAKAIKAINPDAQFGYSREDFSTIKWNNGTTPISQVDIEAKQAELQSDYDAKQYQRDRVKAYPRIEDQLDMQYHDKKDGTTTWEDAVQAVKDANPKP